jgi:hypothetical protein
MLQALIKLKELQGCQIKLKIEALTWKIEAVKIVGVTKLKSFQGKPKTSITMPGLQLSKHIYPEYNKRGLNSLLTKIQQSLIMPQTLVKLKELHDQQTSKQSLETYGERSGSAATEIEKLKETQTRRWPIAMYRKRIDCRI